MPGANPNTPNKRTTPRRPRSTHVVTTVTSAADWSASTSREEGQVVELPSGRSVRAIRLLNMEVLLRSGRIPNPLAAVIHKMMENRQTNFEAEDLQDPEVANQMLGMVDIAVEGCMIEPKAIRPPVIGVRPMTGATFEETEEAFNQRLQEFEDIVGNPAVYNTVSTELIGLEDKMYLFFFSQGGAAELATFRSTTQRAMASVSAGGPVQDATE